MRLIRWEKNKQVDSWQTYRYDDGNWKEEKRYLLSGQEAIYQLLSAQKENFDMALIGLNMPYRNTFYSLMPQIYVIIAPEIVYDYMAHFCQLASGYHDEVAISVDPTLKEQWREIEAFLACFYQAPTEKAAYAVYEAWCLQRSLTNIIADKLQAIFVLFEQEIFNYFSVKHMLKPLFHKG